MLSVDVEANRLRHIALAHKLLEQALSVPAPAPANGQANPTDQDLREMDRHFTQMEAERQESLRQATRDEARRLARRSGLPSYESEE